MKKLILAIMAVVATAAATAQQRTDTLSLTLEDAIRIAMSDNPTIRVAELEVKRQEYVRNETRGNFLPTITASGQYSYAIVKQEMSKGLSFGADNTITGTLSVTMPLFAPAIFSTLQLNTLQMEAAVEAARNSKIELVGEVKKAYYTILLAQQSLSVLEQSAQTLQGVVDNIRTMVQNELASEYDLLSAEVQLSNLQPSVIQTRNSIEISKMMLRMYIGLPQDVNFKVVSSLNDLTTDIKTRAVDLSEDITNNSQLRTLDIQRQMLSQQVKLINTQRMPTLALFGSLAISGNDMEDINFFSGGESTNTWIPNPADYPSIAGQLYDLGRFMGDAIANMMTSNASPREGWWWQNPASVGLQLSIPIFSGFKNVSKVRQTRNQIEQLDIQRDYLEQATLLQLRSAINNIIANREKLIATEYGVEAAQKAYSIAATRYNAGVGTILDLNSAQTSLIQAQLNYSQAIFDYLSSQADYQTLKGEDI